MILEQKLWAMEPGRFRSMAARCMTEDFQSAAAEWDPEKAKAPELLSKQGTIGVLNISGPLFRYNSFAVEYFQGSAYELLMPALEELVYDDSVSAILLNINSPGGEVDGTNQLADLVYEARQIKPVVAYVGGMAASAAYWIASQASAIIIDDTAELGSIGVVAEYMDPKGMYEAMGIKVYEFTSSQSPMKRPDLDSETGQDSVRKGLDMLADIFLGRVARGRGVDTQRVQSDFGRGGTLIGQQAIAAGMADRVGSIRRTMIEMAQEDGMDLSIEVIKDEYPELASQLLAEGAKAERDRIRALDEIEAPAEAADIIKDAKYESIKPAGDVAMQVLKTVQSSLAKHKADLEADAKGVPDIGPDATASEQSNPLIAAAQKIGGKK